VSRPFLSDNECVEVCFIRTCDRRMAWELGKPPAVGRVFSSSSAPACCCEKTKDWLRKPPVVWLSARAEREARMSPGARGLAGCR
jgi:hypothetical protein